MSANENQDPTGIVNAFLVRFLDDLEHDAVAPLEVYLEAFPGYEEAVSRKYHELTGAPCDPSAVGDLPETSPAALSSESVFSTGDAVGADSAKGVPLQPRQVGPYTILECIGEGGMGTVYLAEQFEPMRRRVALKQIKLGTSTQEVIARFDAERQALALMSHSSIAQVFDAGTSADGRPYFVMEYVRGTPLTTFCDRHRLTLEDRLELFVDVTEGVQHAHQKGIIHRDLKPSNVLVSEDDGRAVPKIIDFGIAKSLVEPLAGDLAVTRIGQAVGTPYYMSPEQIESGAKDVDTRADIYSLGVVLYELVAGVLPFDTSAWQALGPDKALQKLLEEVPQRPSTRLGLDEESAWRVAANRRLEPRVLRRRLRGELDWIAMKALERDRARRYASASEFGEDVRRFLRHEAVLAGPPTLTYRLTKLIRRYRTAIAASLLVVALVAAAMAGVNALHHSRQRQESVRRYEEGQVSWENYTRGTHDIDALEKELATQSRRLEDWEPVWKRDAEYRLLQEVDSERRRLSELYSQALISFYRAFEFAPTGAPERRRAYREIRRLHGGDGTRDFGGLDAVGARTRFLPPEFFSILFRDAGLGEVDREFDSWEPLTLDSQPSGAEVYCFRYELRDGTLVPRPVVGSASDLAAAPRMAPPAGFLEVDRVWKDLGQEASLYEPPPFEPRDRILEVGGHPVELEGDLLGAVQAATDPGDIEVKIQRGGEERILRWRPAVRGAELDNVESIRRAFGFTVSAYPLTIDEEFCLGSTPLQVPLGEGSYLLVLRHAGFVETRFPVVVPRLRRDEAKAVVRLLRSADLPPGFVHVPGGRFVSGGDPKVHQSLELASPDVAGFLMSRLEVTVREYQEFLDAPENRSRIDSDGRAPPLSEDSSKWLQAKGLDRVQLVPFSNRDRDKLLFEDRAGRWVATGYGHPDWPVVGVSINAAAEYAGWRSRQVDGRWRYRLPTDLEWEKAARGVDGRSFVWGNYPTWSFCLSAKGIRGTSHPDVVGAYPRDESVYGIRDLAGSASEPTTDVTEGNYLSVRGGNWRTVNDYFFRVANRNGRFAASKFAVDQGIRLVAEPKR